MKEKPLPTSLPQVDQEVTCLLQEKGILTPYEVVIREIFVEPPFKGIIRVEIKNNHCVSSYATVSDIVK